MRPGISPAKFVSFIVPITAHSFTVKPDREKTMSYIKPAFTFAVEVASCMSSTSPDSGGFDLA